MLKKILLIAAGLALLGGLVAALVIFQPWGLIGWDRTPGMGNTPSNMVGGGLAAGGDGWHYFPETLMDKKLVKMPAEGGAKQIIPVAAQGINVVGDHIYYIGDDGIYKIKTDGTGNKMICSGYAYNLNYADGWLYYISDEDNRLYRIRTNGTGKKRLTSVKSSSMNVLDGWIYYSDNDANRIIRKMRLDGTEDTQVGTDQDTVAYMVAEGEWIYFLSSEGNGRLYKMKTDGTEKVLICDDAVRAPNVANGWVYYTRFENGKRCGLYRIRTDGTERQMLTDEVCRYHVILGEWIYYRVDPEGMFWFSPAYRMKIDGTQKEVLGET